MSLQRIQKITPYFIIVMICTCLFAKPFGNGDELWNYSFARNIADGMLPYRDFNIILTPLSVYLAGFFLYVFGNGLIVHRILCYILAVAIFCTAYHLCLKVSKNSFISIISVLLLYVVHFPYFIYNYNYLSVLFLLLIFEIETNNKAGTTGKHLLTGLIVGMTVLTKQSTGAIIIIANLIVCLHLIRHSNHRKGIIISRILVSGAPMFFYVIYLLVSGTFGDFWEYAVKGITTFTHRTTPIDLITSGPGNMVFFAIIIIGYYLIFKEIVRNRQDNTLISMLVFNISWIMVAYPLCDAGHFLCLHIPLVPVVFFV